MIISEVFRNLVTFLRVDPAGERVDQLLAELIAQTALSIHNHSKSHHTLRSVASDIPSVYYALDDLLNEYGYQLTVRRGINKGIITLGIDQLTTTHKHVRTMPLVSHQKPVNAPPTANKATA